MTILLGNDEFILYIRKHHPACSLPNDALGRRIWVWIQTADPNATKTEEDAPCYWGGNGLFITEDRLPKTATQFSFQRTILPNLYDFLDSLGQI
jgi:hypothetical protein